MCQGIRIEVVCVCVCMCVSVPFSQGNSFYFRTQPLNIMHPPERCNIPLSEFWVYIYGFLRVVVAEEKKKGAYRNLLFRKGRPYAAPRPWQRRWWSGHTVDTTVFRPELSGPSCNRLQNGLTIQHSFSSYKIDKRSVNMIRKIAGE